MANIEKLKNDRQIFCFSSPFFNSSNGSDFCFFTSWIRIHIGNAEKYLGGIVSGPYSSNADPDPAENLNPDPVPDPDLVPFPSYRYFLPLSDIFFKLLHTGRR